MRVLAVDPGLTRCGIGVIDSGGGNSGGGDSTGGRRATMVAVGVVRTPAADPVQARLLAISEGLDAWLDEHIA